MRVIAGEARGTRLKAAKSHGAGGPARMRPTLDRVKEAIFDIIGDRVVGARVLDLFAGSGSLGIEALSRGAADAIFVERETSFLKVIAQNLRACHFEQRGTLLGARVETALRILERRGERFQIILMDPPYRRGLARKMVQKLAEGNLITDEGLVMIEHDPTEELPNQGGQLRIIDARRYGDTAVSFMLIGD